MANLTEFATWEDEIYQIEPDDPVQGGVDGVDNLPHKQLANRTTHNKQNIDKILSPYGLSKLGSCASITELRQLEPQYHGQRVQLKAYEEGGIVGGGTYIADTSDTTTLDDGATCIVTETGRWKRLTSINNSIVPELSAINRAFSLQKIGEGENNLSQSFVVDDINRFIFTHHESDRKGYLVRYNLDYNPFDKIAIDTMQCLQYLGHQGLGVQHLHGQSYLWASAGESISNAGRSVIRFKYKANGTLEQSDIETFLLFDDEFRDSNTTPCISQDQKYLVARGRLKSTNQTVLRVFDVQDTDSQHDLTNKYVSQFGIDPITFENDEFPVQGIACDGQVIVVQLGYHNVKVNKMLLVYSISGELLYRNDSSIIGKDDALNIGTGIRWEPEGICFARNGHGVVALYHHIMSGDPGERIEYVYSNVRSNAQFQSFNNQPALFLRGIRDIAVPEDQKLTLAQAIDSDTDTYHDFFDIYPSGFNFYNKDKEKTFAIGITQSSDKDRVEIRGKQNISKGSGINLYNQGDVSAGKIKLFTGGDNSQTLSLEGDKKVLHWCTDGLGSIGSASNRIGEIFASTGTINTSDERDKQDIIDIPDEVIQAWRQVSFSSYKWKESVEKKGQDARKHIGLLAQKIKEAFEENGLDATEYGLLCYDEWEEQAEVVEQIEVQGEDGNITHIYEVISEAKSAGNRWGIRAEQCLFLEAESNRRLVHELAERMAKVEAKS